MPQLKAALVPVTPLQQNCTLLWDEATKNGLVVDPGGDVLRIQQAIAETGITVEAILLTHGHVDHASGAMALKDALGVEIIGPDERDRFLLESLEEKAAEYGIPGARNVTPDRWLTEGETVEVAGFIFDVYHCPGHTPGHLVFVEATARFAQVGDAVFRGSIGRTDFPYGDTEALVTSIRTKLWPLGDDIVFVCGHGPASTFGDERRSNPFVGDYAGPLR